MERLGVDLSWESAQMEGNTYSLLETERLLRERKEAQGKSYEEAIMLLNHKCALDYILDEPTYLQTLSLHHIEEIHTLLTQDLGVDAAISHCRMGITGTRCQPLDNEFQIHEALLDACQLINDKGDVFEKVLLVFLLLSYIQPFADGNKRTARIVGNGIFISQYEFAVKFYF